MKVTTERLENCQVKVFVELDEAEIDKKLRQTARKISRQFNVPGYRKGKAPYHTVVRVFGREAVQQQALEDFGNELYEQALQEIDYELYDRGELEDVEWDPFRMTVLVPIQPDVDLGDYRAVRVPFEVEEITDEQVEEYLADLQQQYAQWVPVERPAALGDQVVIDMEGKVGDQLFMSNEEYEMLLEEGGASPLPGFHEEVVGLSPGEDKTFTLTLPEDDFDENIAGQEGTITVQLHTVREKDLPPLDDDLALMVGDYETLDDLRAAARTELEADTRQRADAEYLDKALEAIIEAAVKIEYPSQVVDQETERALDQLEQNLATSGISLEAYLRMIGKTREMYKQELRPVSEERLKKRLALVNIATGEGISVEPEEVEAEVERLVEAMGDQAEKMREMLDTPGGRLSVADNLMVSPIEERIIQIAKGEAPPLEEEEEVAESQEDAAAAGEGEAETETAEVAAEEATEESEESVPEAEAGPSEEGAADTEAPEGEETE